MSNSRSITHASRRGSLKLAFVCTKVSKHLPVGRCNRAVVTHYANYLFSLHADLGVAHTLLAESSRRRTTMITRTDRTGISNRPLEEEIGRQDRLPARGRRRSGRGTDRPTEPAPARRRGRSETSDQEVPVSTRADSAVGPRP